jgi:hypothetical protein
MKNKMLLIVWIVTLFMAIQVHAQTVYVTKTGAKYHKSTCQYLKYSKIESTVEKATNSGYTACSVCKPPTTTGGQQPAFQQASPSSQPPKSVTARQCSGITKAGTRCKRTTTNANGRCYQH